MEVKKPIYKAREIDLPATIATLERGESITLPFRPETKPTTVRVTVCRINQNGEPKYTTSETLNGMIIKRTA